MFEAIVEKFRQSVVKLSLKMHGCRVIQKAVALDYDWITTFKCCCFFHVFISCRCRGFQWVPRLSEDHQAFQVCPPELQAMLAGELKHGVLAGHSDALSMENRCP